MSSADSESRPGVFVLMPFDDEFFDVYENLIKAPLEAIGFEVKRADSDLNNQTSVLRDFVVGIVNADLVVVDVTGLNSNVMYELGLAHALGARTVTITQDLTELPFDLKTFRANEYSTHFTQAHLLGERLKSIGTALLEGEPEFGNPIQDFAPEALRSGAPVRGPLSSGGKGAARESEHGSDGDGGGRREDADDDPDPGFLEASVEIERIAESLSVISTSIGSRTQVVGENFAMHTQRMDAAQKRLGQKAPAAVLAIANQMALELNDFCDDIEPKSEDFARLIVEFNDTVEVMAREATITDQADVDAARGAIESSLGLEEAFVQNGQSVREFAATMEQMPNATKSLRQSSRRTAAVVNGLAERIEEAAAETARIRGISESRLQAYERASR